MVRSLGRVAPELDLTSNRALRDLCGQSGIEDEFVGYLDGLAHTVMVAFCYQAGKSSTRGFLRSGKKKKGTLLRRRPPERMATRFQSKSSEQVLLEFRSACVAAIIPRRD